MHEFMAAIWFDDGKVVGAKLNLDKIKAFWVGVWQALKDNGAVC